MKSLSEQILRFGVVGVGATLTHYCTLALLVERFSFPPPLANTLAFLTALGITYLGQSLWVFQNTTHTWMKIRKFLVVAVSGMTLHFSLMWITLYLGYPYPVGFLFATIVVPTLTFLMNKRWVFTEASVQDQKKETSA